MVMGTGSDVGKSLLVAGLCRAFARRGLRVRPFKPQNMSNNAAVVPGGGEIGRAQALQARACGVAPTVHMNPVLLKPQTETGAQVILRGAVLGAMRAREYQQRRGTLMPAVLESFRQLAAEADLVIVEGAGSASEVNLRAGDIANMGFAEAADLPVVLVGDIDRGGVIAAVVGTCAVLPPAERARIRGFVINKFRGDPSLFDDGLAAVVRHTGLAALGVVPWFAAAARLPAEDALALPGIAERPGAAIRVAVPMLARIANFDDLDPLRLEPDVSVRMVPPGSALPGDADLVVLPGSKSTIADLAFLRAQGWDIDLEAHRRRGGWILGLCGGFQMLGQRLDDPEGTEGPSGSVAGLGLLKVDTVLHGAKTLSEVSGTHPATGTPVRGYEMHIGRTRGPGLARPLLDLDGRPEGAVSVCGRVMGTYVHGIFAEDRFRAAFLSAIRVRGESGLAYEAEVEAVLDELADHLAGHLDLDRLLALAAEV
ncbi:cobyric acid synthase [Arenibaculum pallidiluteum]|uniref:cobyric acid synthase n=1 Tax=Arenibaculum pallidiluteum TaxID=2812559 RepID=UPI001A95B3B3|nr:cobyric acid synthase [Arenibaculum pallidiluteum]